MAVMLTTVDNPHDPRLAFPEWYAWDVEHGYNTSALLARIVDETEGFPQAVIDADIEKAADAIIEMHDGGIYKKLIVEEEPTAA